MAQQVGFLPIPCPRCHQGVYLSQRALSLHMNKCAYDLFQSSSSSSSSAPAKRSRLLPPTNAQRARQILQSMNSSHLSGTSRNENRLAHPTTIATMPSSSTGLDMDHIDFDISCHDNVYDPTDNTDDAFCHINNNLLSTTTSNSDHDDNNNSITSNRAMILPPGAQFGIHLQHILSSHRGVDLKLYDQITDLVTYHSTIRNTDLSSVKLYHRKELTSTITSLYNLQHLKHTNHNVTLSDSSVVTVPVFDVKSIILSILQDPQRMNHENFASGYDIFTGYATQPITHLDEIHTGALWPIARDHYCQGAEGAFPLALLCFYDKTHTDLYGSLSCAPFLMTLSFFNEAARCCDKFYEVLAYIPNLTYGSGKSNPKQSRDKLADEHKCLKLVTDQIKHLASGFDAVVLGKTVTIKPWIHFISGDTSGHNNIVGQFNSSNAAYPYRDCKCTLAQLSDSVASCSLITLSEYFMHKQDQTLHQLSLHDTDNSFIDLPFGDLVHGVFGCVPAEMLHVSGNGIMQYMLGVVYDIIGSGNNKQMNLHLLDTLHQNMVRDALTQSERDMPRMSDRNGVTDGTKMSASERVGNIFILLCAMHTQDGIAIFEHGCYASGVSFENMKKCLKLQLGFEVWVNQSNALDDVQSAIDVVAELMTLIKTAFPRRNGNGWCIPKMHSLSKMIHYMQQFGKAKNFCGQVGERVLKTVVKNHAQQTQRRVNVFASQCADRQFESSVYKYAYDDMELSLTGNIVRYRNQTLHHVQCKGKHTIRFNKCDSHGRGDVEILWADKLRNKRKTDIHEIVQYALRSHACAHDWKDEFVVNGYTSAHITLDNRREPVLFHANTNIYGDARYHFCMVEFSDGVGESEEKHLCPARILDFVQFITPGFPTPCGKDDNSINGEQLDNSVFAVIHAASDYVSLEKLKREFICPFTLGDPKTCVYIVDIQNILEPLFVFRNYGKSGSHHLCTLPYRRWGEHFQYKLR